MTENEVLYRPEDISIDGTFRKGVIIPFFHSQDTMVRTVPSSHCRQCVDALYRLGKSSIAEVYNQIP